MTILCTPPLRAPTVLKRPTRRFREEAPDVANEKTVKESFPSKGDPGKWHTQKNVSPFTVFS